MGGEGHTFASHLVSVSENKTNHQTKIIKDIQSATFCASKGAADSISCWNANT